MTGAFKKFAAFVVLVAFAAFATFGMPVLEAAPLIGVDCGVLGPMIVVSLSAVGRVT